MKPSTAYRRLNSLLWMNRLPTALVMFVENEYIPRLRGITLYDDLFVVPVILLNHEKHWGKTLVHECLHVAEPALRHGEIFNTIVDRYWKIAKEELKGWNIQ